MSYTTSVRLINQILIDLDTPISLSVAIKLRYGDIGGIIAMSVDPRDYLEPARYFRDAQALALFQKREKLDLGDPLARRKAAIQKWWDGERFCFKSNERLSRFHYPLDGGDRAIGDFLSSVRRKVQSWIGVSPPNLDTIKGRFGPGATTSDRGRLTTVPDKMSSTPELTHGAFWYILPHMQNMWGRTNSNRGVGLSWTRGNVYMTVPKNAKIDRSIAIEPSINVFYQLGLGRAMRSRLALNTGWDLNRVADLHRKLAREGSVSGEWATIDLSNASDTLCYELVKLVMPHRWFKELEALRSPFTLIDGRWVKLEKFSSMGNGYTFELETIVFAALISVFMEKEGRIGELGHDVFVFGDDIIVPCNLAQEVITMLAFFGFSTNREKTFVADSHFRESCGGDYFKGFEVRPIFFRRDENDPRKLVPYINQVRDLYRRLDYFSVPNDRVGWYILLDVLPADIKGCRGPEGLGDAVIHDDASNWRFKWKHGIRYFRSVKVVPDRLRWHHWIPEVQLASVCYDAGGSTVSDFRDPDPPASRVGSISAKSQGLVGRNPPSKVVTGWVPYS